MVLFILEPNILQNVTASKEVPINVENHFYTILQTIEGGWRFHVVRMDFMLFLKFVRSNNGKGVRTLIFRLAREKFGKKMGGIFPAASTQQFFLLIKIRAFTAVDFCYFHCSQLNSDTKEFFELFTSISFISFLTRGWVSRRFFPLLSLGFRLGHQLGFRFAFFLLSHTV